MKLHKTSEELPPEETDILMYSYTFITKDVQKVNVKLGYCYFDDDGLRWCNENGEILDMPDYWLELPFYDYTTNKIVLV